MNLFVPDSHRNRPPNPHPPGTMWLNGIGARVATYQVRTYAINPNAIEFRIIRGMFVIRQCASITHKQSQGEQSVKRGVRHALYSKWA